MMESYFEKKVIFNVRPLRPWNRRNMKLIKNVAFYVSLIFLLYIFYIKLSNKDEGTSDVTNYRKKGILSIERLLANLQAAPKATAFSMQHKETNQDIPVLTLFTTFSEKETIRFGVQNYTVKNWSQLLKEHGIVPVVYGQSVSQLAQCEKYGFKSVVLTDELTNDGRPILKELFRDAAKRFQSQYYGFLNGDILLHGKDMMSTLTTVTQYVQEQNIRSFLLMGMRIDLNFFINGTLREMSDFSDKGIQQLEWKGIRHADVGAYDIFISTKDSFPWVSIPDYVVSLPAFDSWLMIFGQKAGIPIIDITESTVLLHQSGVPKLMDKNYRKLNDRNKRIYHESVKQGQVGWSRVCAHYKTRWRHGEVSVVKNARDSKTIKRCVPTKPLYIPIL